MMQGSQRSKCSSGVRWAPVLLLLSGCGNVVDELYAEQLTLTAIEPAEGPSAGGSLITLRGTALCPDLRVTFDGVDARKVEVLSRNVALVETPGHPIGRASVAAACSDQTSPEPISFSYYATDVVLTSDIQTPTGTGYWHFADFD